MGMKGLFSLKGLYILVLLAAVPALFLTGCGEKKKAKEEAAPAVSESAPGGLPQGHPAMDKSAEDIAKVSHAAIKSQKEVKLSEEVKAKWKEVKLEITDNARKSSSVATFKVGDATPLGKDGFKVKVEAFVPDYAISDSRIESRSNEPKNPAVLVELFEGDKSVARGWVFKDFPEFNSYNNPRFKLVLVSPGGAKKR